MAMGKGTVNKVILIGRLGGEPELKYTQSGTAVTNFSLATNMVWKDQAGNQQEKTEWHRIVAWRRTAEIVGEYVSKGHRIYVEGRLETRSWEQDGQKRYMTEVIADNIQLLESKKDQSPREEPLPNNSSAYEPPTASEGNENYENDLPF